ncbi:MAG: hypothetical protein COB41_00240 [Proteobacteria bacterium]|nr:MAG: hypothetical protein COB41_00240 [Pseudomonadota bacterium]
MLWIFGLEDNHGLIKGMSFSKEFDKAFRKEYKVGPLFGIRTIIGDSVVIVESSQKENIKVY